MLIVKLEKTQLLRLKEILLKEMEYQGYDDEWEDYKACVPILDALEEAVEEKVEEEK